MINKTYTFGHYFKSSRFRDFAGVFQQKHLRASQKLGELKGSPEGFSKKYMNGCNANVSSPPKVNIIRKSLKKI